MIRVLVILTALLAGQARAQSVEDAMTAIADALAPVLRDERTAPGTSTAVDLLLLEPVSAANGEACPPLSRPLLAALATAMQARVPPGVAQMSVAQDTADGALALVLLWAPEGEGLTLTAAFGRLREGAVLGPRLPALSVAADALPEGSGPCLAPPAARAASAAPASSAPAAPTEAARPARPIRPAPLAPDPSVAERVPSAPLANGPPAAEFGPGDPAPPRAAAPVVETGPPRRADGTLCRADADCRSGTCAPGPGRRIQEAVRYCLARGANCAYPGTPGARIGERVLWRGTALTCRNPNQSDPAGCADYLETRPGRVACLPQFLP